MNEALRHLGEEHRLGMIKTEEFRNRRRALLESWGDLGSTTAPGLAANASLSTTQTNPGSYSRSSSSPDPEPEPRNWALIVFVATIVLAGAAGSWLALKPDGRDAPVYGSIPERSDALQAAMRKASAFRSKNSWSAADTEAFLQEWRSLSAEERQIAQDEPSLRSLLHELERNIEAERQALEFTPSAEGQERLERLRAFAEELRETGS